MEMKTKIEMLFYACNELIVIDFNLIICEYIFGMSLMNNVCAYINSHLKIKREKLTEKKFAKKPCLWTQSNYRSD